MDTRNIVYEVQTRCWLNELSTSNVTIHLDQVPERALEEIKNTGAEWLWLMGVWQTGEKGRRIAAEHPDLQASYHEALADFSSDDVSGSPYSIQDYHVSADFGGDEALAVFRKQLAAHGLKLLLDFVPNHLSLDNTWLFDHPEYFIQGIIDDVAAGRGVELETVAGPKVLLHGRDPYFPPWTDTLQLDWSNVSLLAALEETLLRLASMCDGLRCDMAMLLLKDVFARTWGRVIPISEEPWKELLAAVKKEYPSFIFAAEAYWDLEWNLVCQGFDYVYDKRLYDRLCSGNALAVREHLAMDMNFHSKQLRFLENHDEPRVAARLSWSQHRAALAILSILPGGWLLHHHQSSGARIKLPVQLKRYAAEPPVAEIAAFYEKIFKTLRKFPANCQWEQLGARMAWTDNYSCQQFVAACLHIDRYLQAIVAVNFASSAGQCYLDLGDYLFAAGQIVLEDIITGQRYERDTAILHREGLYVSLPAFEFHYFTVVSGD